MGKKLPKKKSRDFPSDSVAKPPHSECREPELSPRSAAIKSSHATTWRRKWQPTPVCWPGESHGQRSLVGYSPGGHRESDTPERLKEKKMLQLKTPNINISILPWGWQKGGSDSTKGVSQWGKITQWETDTEPAIAGSEAGGWALIHSATTLSINYTPIN